MLNRLASWRGLLLAALTLVAAPLEAGRPAPVAAQGEPGMVSAADPRAAAAGVELLRRGGRATDAAIATMLALNVVEPHSAALPGGAAFFAVYEAASGGATGIDGGEAAPRAADARWFYRPDGTPLGHEEAI